MSTFPSQIFKPEMLDGYLDRFEIFEMDNGSSLSFQVLPLGAIQILFQLRHSVYHSTSFTNGWEKRPKAFLAGPYNLGYSMAVDPGVKIFSLKFLPGRYQNFFPNPIDQFKNLIVPLEDVWGPSGQILTDKVFNASCHKERCKIVEQFLVRRFLDLEYSPIELAVQSLIRDKGMGRVKRLAEVSNLSPAQFRKRFTKEIGLSPKEFQRIIRIGAVHNHYCQFPTLSLTQLAYTFRYYDQSHFIHDFRSITGQSPMNYYS
ncbi:MAG: helix-turn-helix domain-containing protein [Reichenbachiella sp.]|uniref:helix-turn-helix domain-containing protein n=1 Tax=Reichenbachiella sp. TaxID=2184521 RepID=UPI00326539D2